MAPDARSGKMPKRLLFAACILAALCGCATATRPPPPLRQMAAARIHAAQQAVAHARAQHILWAPTLTLLVRARDLQAARHYRQAAHVADTVLTQCRLAAAQRAANRHAHPFYPPAYRQLPARLWPSAGTGS